MWDRHGMEELQRRWRRIGDEYADTEQGPRIFVAEAYLPNDRRIHYVSPGRLHQSFNFEFLETAWQPESLRLVITHSLELHQGVNTSPTWVSQNHDVPRAATRLGKSTTGIDFTQDGSKDSTFLWHEMSQLTTDLELGGRRARAMAMLMLALPGGCYVYQGEELGLEEVEDLPEEALQDPKWERSGHVERGRDGCRVPIPWSGDEPPYGFSSSTRTWLPQPKHWGPLTVAAQTGDPDSMLELYRSLLAHRRTHPALGGSDFSWDQTSPEVLSFTRGPGFRCVVNLGKEPCPVTGDIIIASGPLTSEGLLPRDVAVWLRV